MRVHRLEVTAFGPFATTQTLDFDPLNDAGVFLLTGPTGAGKTSVLDAICFALYGQVPGDRDKAKAYRSHHAEPGVPPRVVAEVTLQGRRLRISRTAAWPRPSSRARSGFVEEKARATVEEQVDDRWVVRSTRVDEAGHLVSRLLGLTREQFCQVVLLPQGDFAAFLRAGARDRQRILESLFATQRFKAVERWLADHRSELGRACREREVALGRLVARLQEVVEWTDEDRLDDLAARVQSQRALVEQRREQALRADDAAKAARHAFDEGRALVQLRSRYQTAQQHHAALLALHDLATAREEAVRRARAAAGLLPLIDLARQARSRLDGSEEEVRQALQAFSGWPELRRRLGQPPTVPTIEATAADLADELARVDALRGVEVEIARLTAELATDDETADRLAEQVVTLDRQLRDDPAAVALLRTEVARAERSAGERAAAHATVAAAARAMDAASLVRDRDRELKTLRAARLEAREVAAAANEAWLDARQRYLAGVAAELATTLEAGSPCPVCGSVEHPSPAAPTLEHVTPDEEDALMGVARAAREVVERIDAELLRVEQARADALAGSGGLSRKAARKRHDDALAAAEAADRAVVEHETLSARLSDLIAATEDRRERRESCARDLSAVRERLATARRRLDECREQRAQAVGPDGDLGKRRDCLAAQGKACRRLLEAAHAEAAAVEASAFADHRLADAVTASEFADIDDVLEAALPPSEIANAEALARSYAADLAAAQRTLDDPNLVDAAAQAAPDLEALEASAEDAAATAGAARSTYDAMARAVTRLESLSDDITAELATLNPLRAAYDLADDVAGICTGTSPDNPTRTALSHYVLGARLAQVVEAANSRLQSIAGGRYRLLHTTAREAGDTRGGLGLLVSDLHTDQVRDPVTLSGGETFYVSLSLALGLADVVAHEAGGAELATLFVDEGFGSLDDATRDEVLDELDALRAGGRTVGLVSHLAELRSRFPTQIRINATRNGSQCLSTSTWTSDREAEWTGDER